MVKRAALLILLITAVSFAGEEDYYRIVDVAVAKSTTPSRDPNWRPGNDIVLEASGVEVLDGNRVAIATRRGEIWIVSGAYSEKPADVSFTLFATALHEPLGLLKQGDAFYVVQRTELTRVRDTDGDGVADEYITVAKGWNVSGNYHEYAFGPKADGAGNLWLTLCLGMGETAENSKAWRGWGIRVAPDGKWTPSCAGMRSPSGLGANAAGDMFFSDQQGNWIPSCSLQHMRHGAFCGNPEALKTLDSPQSPVHISAPIPAEMSFPRALENLPQIQPPAVWFPYHKMGESSTDVVLDTSGGKFGPFQNQLFVGDFTSALISRVFLEKVGGEYQGACFPFRKGFASAVVRMAIGADGSMFVGMSNRGWTSMGTASYGLQRLVWTGKTPFEIKELKAQPDGFELVFTTSVDKRTAENTSSYAGSSYTYLYHEKYGSPEIETQPLNIVSAMVKADGQSVRLVINNLRKGFVHELHAAGIRSEQGAAVLHPSAYYTLNNIPIAGR